MADILATESEVAALGGGSTSNPNLIVVKSRVSSLGCIVASGTYSDNQCVCLKDIKRIYTVYYTTTDESLISGDRFLCTSGGSLISNTYSGGQGRLCYSSPIYRVGYEAFMNNSKLVTIDFSNACTSDDSGGTYGNTPTGQQFCILSKAFYGCNNLTTVKCPPYVNEIDDYAFWHCDKLSTITGLETHLEFVFKYAFYNCSSLRIDSLFTNNKVILLEEYAFYQTQATNLIIRFKYANEINKVIEWAHFIGDYCFGFTNASKVQVTGMVKDIKTAAFTGIHIPHEAILGNGVQRVTGNSVFMQNKGACEDYESKLTLASTITNLSERAFYWSFFGMLEMNITNSLSIDGDPIGKGSWDPNIIKINGYADSSHLSFGDPNYFLGSGFPIVTVVEPGQLTNLLRNSNIKYSMKNGVTPNTFYPSSTGSTQTTYNIVNCYMYNIQNYHSSCRINSNISLKYVLFTINGTSDTYQYRHVKFIINNNPNCTFYLNSSAESGWDYGIAWNIDYTPPETLPDYNSAGVKYHTKDSGNTNLSSSNTLSSYIKCSYPNDGKEHFIYISYRNDGGGTTDPNEVNVLYDITPLCT